MSSKFVMQAGHIGRNSVMQNAIAFLRALPQNKSWTIEIKQHRKTRSLSQNAALWACAYPPLMEFMGERGEAAKLRLHEYVCGEFFGWVHPKIGQAHPRRTTTHNETGQRDEIDAATMWEVYEYVQRLGAENGVFVPEPDPMYAVRERFAA